MLLHITPWERSVLELLANGTTTNELAGRLGIAERDLERDLTALFARMGATSPADAVAVAARRGLLRADAPACL